MNLVKNMQQNVSNQELIEELRDLHGKAFCPCSGRDVKFILDLVGSFLSDFVFCDLRYKVQNINVIDDMPIGWVLVSSISGFDTAQNTKHTRYNSNRIFRPAAKVDKWRRPDQTEVAIEFRRDLAEDFLIQNCTIGSITCFVHIGDGEGEGGSNLRFLSMSKDYPENGFLEETCKRLTRTALVITDGCLADTRFLNHSPFELINRLWEPIYEIDGRHGQKIGIWKTTELKSV